MVVDNPYHAWATLCFHLGPKKKNLEVDCLCDSTCNLYSMLWGSSYKDKNATRRFTSTKQDCAYFFFFFFYLRLRIFLASCSHLSIMHASYFSNFGIENEFSALIFAYFPPLMGFKDIGQPFLSLGICVFFSRQVSRSSTVNCPPTQWAGSLIIHCHRLKSRFEKRNSSYVFKTRNFSQCVYGSVW